MSSCRFCKKELIEEFVDLGFSPRSNALLKEEQFSQPEMHYPLRVKLCHHCFLVQTEDYGSHEEIFNQEYTYFSSYSKTWLEHSKNYVELIQSRYALNSTQLVVELASNDGYLLQYFKEKGIRVLGVEPSANTAAVAVQKGVPTRTDFFGVRLAQEMKSAGESADLIVANNVLAHVPDILDFVQGAQILLKNDGFVTMEFPHLLRLIQYNQFDTIYHEHYSYLSFFAVHQIFTKAGLRIFNIEELPTHGGSLRIFACRQDFSDRYAAEESVDKMLLKETAFGLDKIEAFAHFQNKVNSIKNRFNKFLIDTKLSGKTVAGYGAAAKGNTLVNFCGIRKDLIQFIVDASPHKQNKYTPGTHIPIVSEDHIHDTKPDYVVIFPWNIRDEIADQLEYIRRWGGKFVVTIPQLEIF